MTYKRVMSRCEACTDPTKTRVETVGPETGNKVVVTYICDNEECDVKESTRLVEKIKKEAWEPKPEKKPVAKKSTTKKPAAKKTTTKKSGNK